MTERPKTPMFDVVPPEGGRVVPRQKKFVEESEEPEEPRGGTSPVIEESADTTDSFLHKLASERARPPASWDPARRPAVIRKLVWWGTAALVILLGIWLIGSSFSYARIILVADRAFSPFSFEATFDTKTSAPDFSARRLPLQLLRKTVEMKKDYPATGEGTVSAKARGRVTIYNTSATAQTLIATTRLEAPDGKIFRISERVVIPANGNISVEAVALEPGPDYNIGSTRFTIPGLRGSPQYEKIYAESKEPFRGGAVGTTTIVQQEDFRRAQEELSREAFDVLNRDIRAAVPDGFVILDQGATQINVESISINAKAGDAVESFSVSIKASVGALVFDERHVREVARRELRNADFLEDLPDAEFEFAYTPVRQADFSGGTLVLKVDGSLNIAKSVNVAEIKRTLAGKRESDVQKELIAIPGIQEARVMLWPFWMRSLPRGAHRIDVRVE